RHEHGTMCPSYMVTREEKHSTRGRARLLWEMLNNNALRKNGWRDERVKDALDLRLACKACKADCPMNGDMAPYKAELLSHDAQRPTPKDREQAPNAQQSRVILWPDTFNNFFHPETAKAAVEVLEDAGFHVVVPEVDLCCGRPLYDYGMLDTAKRWLSQILTALRSEIEAGTPMIGLEPSCTAVFGDELSERFP